MATTENSFFYWAQAPAPTALPPSMLNPPKGVAMFIPPHSRSQPPPFFVFSSVTSQPNSAVPGRANIICIGIT